MVRLKEGLERDFPVAIENAPEAEAIAHFLEFERVDQRGDRLQPFAQGTRLEIHVDPDPAAPDINLNRGQAGADRVQRAVPVLAVGDVCRAAVQPESPCVIVAAEGQLTALCAVCAGLLLERHRPAAGVVAHQPPAPVRADVVVGLEAAGCVAHDQDRIVADVVGDVVADRFQLLHPARLLPYFRPQPLGLGLGIGAAGEGLGRIGQGFRQRFGHNF